MEDLLSELTINILSRLPVKTIFHCKCVCKKWRNLLLESSFVHLHLCRSPTSIIIHHKPNRNSPGILEWVEIEDKDDYHHLHHDPLMSLHLNLAPILQKSELDYKGCVNGLICLSQNQLNHDNIYICNPVTREYMILPGQRYGSIGFGVSSMTGEYKVIRIKYESSVSKAEVYTLGTAQWRSLGPVPCQLCYYVPFLNNHCHWIANDSPEKLCTFDFDKEIFHLFPSTPSVEEEEAIQGGYNLLYQCLSILKSCLCKIDFYEYHFTVWVMKEYGIKESWHKEIVIKEAICPDLYWPICEPLFLIEGLKDASVLMLCGSKLLVFYPKNKTIEDTRLFDFSFSPVRGMVYRPSFLKLQNYELERVHMF